MQTAIDVSLEFNEAGVLQMNVNPDWTTGSRKLTIEGIPEGATGPDFPMVALLPSGPNSEYGVTGGMLTVAAPSVVRLSLQVFASYVPQLFSGSDRAVTLTFTPQ
jgi:hypothetical protein